MPATRARAATADVTDITLTLARPTAETPVRADQVSVAANRFVRVEVAAVVNPARVPLTFTVLFAPHGGRAIVLGGFSLFPPDNPGTFIVATQGKVTPGGTVRVTLSALQPAANAETIAVRIRSVDLAPG